MMENGKCYLFKHKNKQYEGIALNVGFDTDYGMWTFGIYARCLDDHYACSSVLRVFGEHEISDVEEIENLHFFNTDEMVELLTSMNGELRFIGYNFISEEPLKTENGKLKNEILGEHKLFFKNNDRYIEVVVSYDDTEVLRTIDFKWYYIKVITEKEMEECGVTILVDEPIKPVKVNPICSNNLNCIRFGEHDRYRLGDVSEKVIEYIGNGFKQG